MKQLIYFATAICLLCVSCDKVSTGEEFMQEWETTVTDNPVYAEHMVQFLEEAHKKVVLGSIHFFEDDDRVTWGDDQVGGASPDFLIDEDGRVRVYVSIAPDRAYTYDYSWRVSEEDPMILIFTNDKGEECHPRLISSKDGIYFFEGNFPVMNNNYYDRCVVRMKPFFDASYREQVEERYESAKAENEKQ